MDCNLPCQQLINVHVSGRIDLVGESFPDSSWGPAPQLDALPCASALVTIVCLGWGRGLSTVSS